MVYILDQRLRAQNIPEEKGKKGNAVARQLSFLKRVGCRTKFRYLTPKHMCSNLCCHIHMLTLLYNRPSKPSTFLNT